MRHEHYEPTLSNREFRQRWEKLGSKDTSVRAREIATEILERPHRGLPAKVRSRILARFPDIVPA